MSKALETWYKKLVKHYNVNKHEVGFIIKSDYFIEIPAPFRNVLYWKVNGVYYAATNKHLRWVKTLVKDHPDVEVWFNPEYIPRNIKKIAGKRGAKPKEPELAQERSLEEMVQRIQIKNALKKLTIGQ